MFYISILANSPRFGYGSNFASQLNKQSISSKRPRSKIKDLTRTACQSRCETKLYEKIIFNDNDTYIILLFTEWTFIWQTQ